MRSLELLSPAKNLVCGIEAINHGADAVYIGASRFGARAAAGNSIEDIEQLCRYAHPFGVKVYVTLNTIIFDEELEDTIKLAKQLQDIDVDAILVQDMGLYSSLKDSGIALHASTQTDNRTIEKVQWLSSLGFKRVVLARELSIKEIESIHRAVPDVELEVFVHGALCVSYSGQCYASQYCFNRSANRGECAQFCRMPFTLRDANGNIIEDSLHLLSLKDMAQLDNLERLTEAGATSFKIEGRLKDVDYVKNITAAYSERLNEICHKHPGKYRRASMGRCVYSFNPDIRKSFNRGFTQYFANLVITEHGRKGTEELVSFDTPKSIGEAVGRVKEIRGHSFNVASTAAFCNGDGLCFFDSNRKLIGFRVNRAEGNRLFPLSMPRELKPGTMLYRNMDHAFQTLLSKPSAERKVAIAMTLSIDYTVLSLTIVNEHGISITSSIAYEYQEAQKPQDENIHRQLTKLGGTIYSCNSLKIKSNVKQPFIQSSLLATLRRQAIDTLIGYKSPVEKEIYTDVKKTSDRSLIPSYPFTYLYNASNEKAIDFYKKNNVEDTTSFETQHIATTKMLMQCRYCLRAEMGYCTKNGRKAPWKEPLTISLDDGKTFTLKFNCSKCQMEIFA
ncbi:MAG: U32 family peptidase [Prevotella sp.]|nr:U32 family peptidase [Candidatus Prevotella equi]